jgi:hypothetical protein
MGVSLSKESNVGHADYVRAVLIGAIPEIAGILEEMDRTHIELSVDVGLEPTEINIYSLLSDGFVWPILVPALERADTSDAFLVRCAAVIEELVSTDRFEVSMAAEIRIVEVLADERVPWEKFSRFAGKKTRALVLKQRG